MNKRILVADDEPNILLSLEFLLQQAGYTVMVAYDGRDAILKAASLKPDLVILDVMMPEKNGYEVCQELRESPPTRNLKIMMLTAKGREPEIARGKAVGCDAYVTKPFGTKELLAQVEALLGDTDSAE